jgi:manganese-dependent inorganic pyrophosphatase
MSETIVIGHRNPDTDSVCSAYGYARLKNLLDPETTYLPARCGTLNPQTRFVFDHLGIKPPVFIKDVYPKISDIMTCEVNGIDSQDPILEVMEKVERLKVHLLPVISRGRYAGIVSIFELAEFFMTGGSGRPIYHFSRDNFGRVLDGFYLVRGRRASFRASLFVGAMPYDRFLERVSGVRHEDAVLIVGKRYDHIRYAVEHQFPALILTGFKGRDDIDFDFGSYQGTVFVSALDTAETIRKLIVSVPAGTIMVTDVPTVRTGDYQEDVRELMLKSDYRGLPVVDDDGGLLAVVTRSDLLKKVARRLILVDHNELSQAIEGAEKAEICEIIDHHRLGTAKTRLPVYFYAKPVGSTCTLVYQLYRINQVEIDARIAKVLLAGILSDTVILKSPTTTAEDREAVIDLSRRAGTDYAAFGRLIFSSSDSLKERDPRTVVEADFKVYEEFGVKVGIGQVEIVNLGELDESFAPLLAALGTATAEKGLDWGLLLVTDIIASHSRLLSCGPRAAAAGRILAYRRLEENLFDLPGVLSRKKQLLPEILRVLEELNS